MNITVEMVQSWEPCDEYPEARLRELLGDGITPLEVAELDIPVGDRVWALMRYSVLGAAASTILGAAEQRTTPLMDVESTEYWAKWRAKWLVNKDREVGCCWLATYRLASEVAHTETRRVMKTLGANTTDYEWNRQWDATYTVAYDAQQNALLDDIVAELRRQA